MTTTTVDKKKKRGPESEHYDTLKGAQVRVVLCSPTERAFLRGTLLWVDVYSIGIMESSHKDPTMVYKHNISTIQKVY